MSLGTGNVTVNQRRESTAGLLTGANNGLSLSGTDVQLGGILLQDTDIEQANFQINFLNGGLQILTLDPAGGLYRLGDLGGSGNQTNLTIDDFLQTASINGSGGSQLTIDNANGLYAFGDLGPILNGMRLSIDDAGRTVALGALGGINNGNNINIDDLLQVMNYQNNGGTYLRCDPGNNNYTIGDITGTNNNTYLIIDDAADFTRISRGLADLLLLDVANTIYQIGDISSMLNGSKITIEDTGSIITLDNATNTVGININGVAGFTGTVTPVTSITVNNGIVTAVT